MIKFRIKESSVINNILEKFITKILLIFIVFLILVQCKNSTESSPTEFPTVKELPAININWNGEQSIVCFGTSLTYGYVGESIGPIWTGPISRPRIINRFVWFDENSLLFNQADSAYPRCLDEKLKLKVYNSGKIGATLDNALNMVTDSVLNKNPALVLLEYSANDFLRENDVNETDIKMRTLIDTIKNANIEIILISFVDEYTLNNPPIDHPLTDRLESARAYLNMLMGLSDDYNLLLIKDCFLNIFGNDALMSDDLHPNNEGYMKMSENIITALHETFDQNDMYK